MTSDFERRSKAAFTIGIDGGYYDCHILIIILYNLFDKVQSVFVVGQSRALAMEDGRIAMDLVSEDFLLLESGAGGERPNLLWHEADSVLGVPSNWKFYMITNRVGQLAPPFVGFQSTNNSIAPSTVPRPTDVKFNLYHHDCSFFRGGDYWKYTNLGAVKIIYAIKSRPRGRDACFSHE